MDCPLCPVSIPPDTHDKIWVALQSAPRKTAYEHVIERARTLGISVTRQQAKAHFEYHCPRQARSVPAHFTETAKYIETTTERRRQLIDLLFRVPGLTGEVAGRAIHWNGTDIDNSLIVADKAAQRDLKILIRDDYAHRVFLKNLEGPRARPSYLKGMFFLGVNGRAYIEQLYDIKLKPGDVVRDQHDLADWRLVYPKFEANNLISDLQLELPGNAEMRFASIDGVDVGWDVRNWLGSHLLPVFDDPLRESKKINADGMVALSVIVDGGVRLLPFFYHVDNGHKMMDRLIADLLGPLHMERAGAVHKAFPDVDAATVIPSIVICKDRERLNAIREATVKAGVPRERFLAVACAKDSFDLASPVFSRLFHPAGSGGTRSLLEALMNFYDRRPVHASVLRWQGIRPKTLPGI